MQILSPADARLETTVLRSLRRTPRIEFQPPDRKPTSKRREPLHFLDVLGSQLVHLPRDGLGLRAVESRIWRLGLRA